MYSYWKVKFELKMTQLIYGSYVSFDEGSPCLLHDVYEVLMVLFWLLQRVEHNKPGPTDLDTKQDPVKGVDTHI